MFFYILFLIFSISSQNLECKGNIHAESDNFIIDVTGNQNVPKYEFALKDSNNSSKAYKIQFNSIIELDSLNATSKLPRSNLALSSIDWCFSEIYQVMNNNNNVTTFILNGTSTDRFDQIQFVNHLFKKEENGVSTIGVKFDVNIKNYIYQNEGNQVFPTLVITFSSSEELPNENLKETDKNQFNIGDAFFSSSSTTDEGGQVNLLYKNNELWLIYPHFNQTLHHDPSFGFKTGDNEQKSNAYLLSSKSIPIFLITLFLVF